MAKKTFPSDKQDQYMIRFPEGMRDDLKARAAKSGRSLNAEIVYRLGNSLANPTLEDAGFALRTPEYDGLEFHEDLNWLVVTAAATRGHSVREEIEDRLRQSFKPQTEVIDELSNRYFTALDRLEEARKLIQQLSPGEKLILEERVEDTRVWWGANRTRKNRELFKSLIEHIELRKIGFSGRRVLTLPNPNQKPTTEDNES